LLAQERGSAKEESKTHTPPLPPSLSLFLPSFLFRMYQSDNLKGGHVIMLGGGCEEAALAALRAYPGGLQIGGGVTPESAQKYIDAGASHVIVTSYLFSGKELDFEKLRRMEEVVGKEKLVRPREGGRERCRRARRDEMKRKKTKAHIYVLSLLTFFLFPPYYSNNQVVDLSCRRKAEEGPEGPYYVVKDKWQTYTDFQIK